MMCMIIIENINDVSSIWIMQKSMRHEFIHSTCVFSIIVVLCTVVNFILVLTSWGVGGFFLFIIQVILSYMTPQNL